jgi:hypothetical protein
LVKEAIMKRFVLALALVVAPVAAEAAPATCAERDSLVALLGENFKEAPVALGIADNGRLVEVLTSDAGSTWSIIVTRPDGVSCLVAAGASWQPLVTLAFGERSS